MLTNLRATGVSAMLTIFLLLTGCSSISDLEQATKVSLNYGKTVSALMTIRNSYVEARQSIQTQRHVFDDSEWRVLQNGDQSAVFLYHRLESLRQGNRTNLVIEVSELLNAIAPVRLAALDTRTVIDAHITELPVDVIQSYLTARSDFDVLNGRLESILSRGDNNERAQMLLELFSTIARIAGIVVHIKSQAT